MNQEDLMRMAREAGMQANVSKDAVNALGNSVPVQWLERFAELVAEAEREACATACDALVDNKEAARIEQRVNEVLQNGDEEDQLQAMRHQLTVSTFNAGIKKCAANIRARNKP